MGAPDRVVAAARHHLRGHLRESGELLYSAASTLRRGELYLLGHNPGGDANDPSLPQLGRTLADLATKDWNSYLVSWNGRSPGQAPLQRRVTWLLQQLGAEPRKVAASNLIFMRSRDAAGSRYRDYSALCWPIHEQILEIVRPRLLLAYGNGALSPYRFLLALYGFPAEEVRPSGHRPWVCRSFVVPGRFRVVGVPHLSRYDISAHRDVASWIKTLPRPRRAA